MNPPQKMFSSVRLGLTGSKTVSCQVACRFSACFSSASHIFCNALQCPPDRDLRFQILPNADILTLPLPYLQTMVCLVSHFVSDLGFDSILLDV